MKIVILSLLFVIVFSQAQRISPHHMCVSCLFTTNRIMEAITRNKQLRYVTQGLLKNVDKLREAIEDMTTDRDMVRIRPILSVSGD